jgi:hypothetical protein
MEADRLMGYSTDFDSGRNLERIAKALERIADALGGTTLEGRTFTDTSTFTTKGALDGGAWPIYDN